jgi:hypothetical protein
MGMDATTLVHKEGLYVWDEVSTFILLLLACLLRSLLSPQRQYEGKFENHL